MTDLMTDPWADVRHIPDIPVANADALQLEFGRILADATALLGVARAAQKMGGAYTRETIQAAWDQHLAPALATLPEHLK